MKSVVMSTDENLKDLNTLSQERKVSRYLEICMGITIDFDQMKSGRYFLSEIYEELPSVPNTH